MTRSTILLHSSKTMVMTAPSRPLTTPDYIDDAATIRRYLTRLSTQDIKKSMHISDDLAASVAQMFDKWSETGLSAAIETFRGDIYSGLRALDFTDQQKAFAQDHLVILSGLYGLLRPYDAINSYRLEVGYTFQDAPFKSMYAFWGDRLVAALPEDGVIYNVTSVEYEQLIIPFLDTRRIITPRFLTRSAKTGEPAFVVVHAKIARGAYARWLIQRGLESTEDLDMFDDLGYRYVPELSSPSQPVYVCEKFEGIGLSQRLGR